MEPGRYSLIVGVDLVLVESVTAAIATFGDRYVRRLFTEREVEYCREKNQVAAERFAARFAAKEAVLKVLRPGPSHGVEWKSIEVKRAPEGWCDVVLHGSAERLAVERGVFNLALSMSHEQVYATATVIAHRANQSPAEERVGPSVDASSRAIENIRNQVRGETAVEDQIRSIVRDHGRLSVDVSQLTSDASLYQAGLTSHASVNLMLALEDQFGIEFPERLLRRRTFETIGGIVAAIEELTQGRTSAA